MRTEIRLPCSLFVPRVKESRLCSVCGYTLLDHHLETPVYANSNTRHLNGVTNDDFLKYSRPHTVSPPRHIESQFTQSKNSAFTEYKRNDSKDSIPVSSISNSPVSFKTSPYPQDRRSFHEASMSNGQQILKPKPLPIPRTYLKTQISVSPLIDENRSKEHTPSSQVFKKIKQKKPKERSSSIGENISMILHDDSFNHKNNTLSKPIDPIVRPHNFREILNRFQSAADVNVGFQRHHSVRLPATRRLTILDSVLVNSNSVDLPKTGPTTRVPIPSPRSNKKFDQVFYHEDSDLSDVENTENLDKASPFTPSTALQESNAKYESEKTNANDLTYTEKSDSRPPSYNNTPSYDDDRRYDQIGVVLSPIPPPIQRLSDELSSPEEEVALVNSPMNLKKPLDGLRKSRPVYRSHSTATNRRSAPSTPFNPIVPVRVIHHDIKKHDENFDEKVESMQTLNARTVMAVDYISGSDSGYPRWSGAASAESSSLESPRSPLLHSPNPQRTKATDDVYNQMTVGHTNSLAFVADNFSDISRLQLDHMDLGKETFRNASLSSIVFKSPTPLFMKEKICLYEANFLANNYEGFPVTIMMAPTCHYAPLMGRHAERSGFGPPVITEFEVSESSIRHLVETCFDQRNNIRVVIMPPMSVCSFHSLAAFTCLQKSGMDVNRYEQHVCFIMLQLLSALKYLQSDGVEHMSNNFKEFLLTYRDSNLKIALHCGKITYCAVFSTICSHSTMLQELHSLPKLMLLKETMEEDFDDHTSVHPLHDGGRVGMCKYALRALCTLLNHKMHNTVPDIQERTEFSWPLQRCAELLHKDKSASLTEAKNLIEFAFFVGGQARFENEYDAKLWLDERRAQQVNRMVRLLIEKNEELSDNRERMYTQFLLSSTPRTLFGTFKCLHKR